MITERLLQQPEMCLQHTVHSETDAKLVFFRVLKTMGYPVEINERYGDDFSLEDAKVRIATNSVEEVNNLIDGVRKTRAGDIMFSAVAGAPYFIKTLIEQNQNYGWEGTEHMNLTPRIESRILHEAFVTAYEHVDGYRPTENDRPELDAFYNELISKGVKPLTPEAMGYVFTKTIKYVKRQERARR